jgi:predicted neutral ceramidase superfamily lipid hydrolase
VERAREIEHLKAKVATLEGTLAVAEEQLSRAAEALADSKVRPAPYVALFSSVCLCIILFFYFFTFKGVYCPRAYLSYSNSSPSTSTVPFFL